MKKVFDIDRMRAVVLASVLVFASCSPDPTELTVVTFQFIATEHNELFIARTASLEIIASVREELGKQMQNRSLHINGKIQRGTQGNVPWNWHFVDDQWKLAELSMELCDSWPSYVDENLDKWLEEVGGFCPWSSRVIREM